MDMTIQISQTNTSPGDPPVLHIEFSIRDVDTGYHQLMLESVHPGNSDETYNQSIQRAYRQLADHATQIATVAQSHV